MAHIKLDDVAVDFPIHNAASHSLQLQVLSAVGGKLAQHQKAVVVRALQGVTLSMADGDRVGIVGHNGSGKTTLLRVLAGAYQPTQGVLTTSGQLSSLTDITLGMDPEATGLENILFRLVFMGLTFADARRLSPSIEAFSELGEYLHMPVRTYSTGMYLRLAFAISTAVEPDIIILDEMIGAGDARFLAKAQARMTHLLQRVKILVLATHDAAIMKALCNRIIWLHHGEMRMDGSYDEVYDAYLAANR
jgi:ABC-type polysaccharide/polyol phosphate transport system ATPase subunit